MMTTFSISERKVDCRGGAGKLPRGQDGYILQSRFAFHGCHPPTRLQRLRLLARARLYRPKLNLLY